MSEGFVEVRLSGCDDITVIKIPAEQVSPHEWRRLRVLAYALRQASEYGCQPVMYVEWSDDDGDK